MSTRHVHLKAHTDARSAFQDGVLEIVNVVNVDRTDIEGRKGGVAAPHPVSLLSHTAYIRHLLYNSLKTFPRHLYSPLLIQHVSHSPPRV